MKEEKKPGAEFGKELFRFRNSNLQLLYLLWGLLILALAIQLSLQGIQLPFWSILAVGVAFTGMVFFNPLQATIFEKGIATKSGLRERKALFREITGIEIWDFGFAKTILVRPKKERRFFIDFPRKNKEEILLAFRETGGLQETKSPKRFFGSQYTFVPKQ